MQSASLHLRERVQGEATWPLLTPPPPPHTHTPPPHLTRSPPSLPSALVPLFSHSIFSSHVDLLHLIAGWNLQKTLEMLPTACRIWKVSPQELGALSPASHHVWQLCNLTDVTECKLETKLFEPSAGSFPKPNQVVLVPKPNQVPNFVQCK